MRPNGSSSGGSERITEYPCKLRCRLCAADQHQTELLERLGADGCVDALVGLGQASCVALEFTREAKSVPLAIQCALADARCAMPDAELLDAEPSLLLVISGSVCCQ